MKNNMSNKAVTLVEVIIVLALMGIVAITIIPKLEMTSFKETADVDTFISNIRYAQHESMVTDNYWRVVISSNENKYFIDNDSNNSNELPYLPSGKNPIYLNTSIESNIDEFYFDYLGRPIDTSQKIITTKITVKINSKKIIIEPYSGGIYAE